MTENLTNVPEVVDHLFRYQAGQVVASLTRIFGAEHLDLVEDVVQDTLIKALRVWPFGGIPDNPAGWIMRTAKNGALDVLRREKSLRDKQDEIARLPEYGPTRVDEQGALNEHELGDDQLGMMFMCCQPALSRPARVALTLKTLGGFGVPEIARAFLAEEATIAQRLVRAKRTLREMKVQFEMPESEALPARLDSVLEVLYLLFNEGYSAHQGEDLIRQDLCEEAIRLTHILAMDPAGDIPKVHALLALMLLQASRLPARTDDGGEILLLQEQDRSLWDRTLIKMGLVELARSAEGDQISEYHLQAGIAYYHACAASYEETDWSGILMQYDDLMKIAPSPVVALNRAVVLAKVYGSKIGLRELERIFLMPGMEQYYLFHATRAELCRQSGDLAEAVVAYRNALDLASTAPEQRFLARKLAECEN
ncbi:MAG TPA: sigma-70 family RNA polymerase sigma factor [Chloroflexia bacterium]|nr:sigma-70 family RNA polymerase sigma factor [Chloroflexia bacterium]